MGATFEQEGAIVEGYHIYIGDDQQSLKHHLGDVTANKISPFIEQLLYLYQQHRRTPNETFREFASRYTISDLKSLTPSLELENSTLKTA